MTGPLLPTGGTAVVYLDGRVHRKVDAYSDEDNRKYSEALWHAFGLEDRWHTVRIVTLGEPYGESSGSDVVVENLIVFR